MLPLEKFWTNSIQYSSSWKESYSILSGGYTGKSGCCVIEGRWIGWISVYSRGSSSEIFQWIFSLLIPIYVDLCHGLFTTGTIDNVRCKSIISHNDVAIT